MSTDIIQHSKFNIQHYATMPRWYFAAVAAVALGLLIWQLVEYGGTPLDFGDTPSYLSAWDYIKTLHTHDVRTPVYPLFLGVLRDLFGIQAMMIIVVALQWAMFVTVMPIAWQLCRRLGANAVITGVTISLYMLVPGFWVFNNLVLPESMCGCLLVLLMWLTMVSADTGSRRAIVWSAITVMVLIMTKPVYLYLVALIPEVWFVTARRHRKTMRFPAMLVTGIVAVTFIYCLCMLHTHQVFAPSRVVDMNRYMQLREEGLIRPQDIERDSLREMIAEYYARDPGTWRPYATPEIWHEFGYKKWADIHWINNNAIAHHPRESAVMYLRNFCHSIDYDLFYNPIYPDIVHDYMPPGWTEEPVPIIYPFKEYIRPQVWLGWVIGLWFVALWLWRWWRTRRFPALAYAMGATLICGYIISIAGAPDDWGRLLTPFNMLLPIMLASAIGALKRLFHTIQHSKFHIQN